MSWRPFDMWDDARRRAEVAARMERGMSTTGIARDLRIGTATVARYRPDAGGTGASAEARVTPPPPEAAATAAGVEAAAGQGEAATPDVGTPGVEVPGVDTLAVEVLEGEALEVRALAAWNAGGTHEAIARRFGCSPSTVKRIVRRARDAGGSVRPGKVGWPQGRPRPDVGATVPPVTEDPRLPAALAAWNGGGNLDAAAAAVGVSRNTVKALLARARAAGLEVRVPTARARMDHDEVVRMRNAGATLAEIAARYGVKPTSVGTLLVELRHRGVEVERRPPGPARSAERDAEKAAVLARLDTGATVAEAAAALGLTAGAVEGIARRAAADGWVRAIPARRGPAPGPKAAAAKAARAERGRTAEAAQDAAALAKRVLAALDGGQSQKATAAALGISEGRVAGIAYRARRRGWVCAAQPARPVRPAAAPVEPRSEPRPEPRRDALPGAPKRPAVAAVRRASAGAKRKAPPGRVLPMLREPPAPLGFDPAASEGPARPGGFTVLDSRFGTCRYVVEVTAEPGRHGLTHLMCGGPAILGQAWCAEHRRIVYAVPSARVAATARAVAGIREGGRA